jgi:DNA invertase Pin-like site-specific DNA recombinase
MKESKPLAYGYMSVSPDVDDKTIRQVEQKLKGCAEAQDLSFAAIFHEFTSGSFTEWRELVRELQRAEAHHVIMPSLNHLTQHMVLRQSLLDQLEHEAKAEVHELGDL